MIFMVTTKVRVNRFYHSCLCEITQCGMTSSFSDRTKWLTISELIDDKASGILFLDVQL